jgi:hypothetical protein
MTIDCIPLEDYEQDILDSVERGEWQSVPNLQQEIDRYQRHAQADQPRRRFTFSSDRCWRKTLGDIVSPIVAEEDWECLK